MELKHATKLQKGFDIRLLIVPYGIETTISDPGRIPNLAFNRTLWN